ncbi:MAG: right-handed parallel beta-helix repeat-containing protein [candidate division Zixibacteria bacterium]|nr:right-handed parallel beta-helix repeat-containing protein [candidate division Zixibacteria bacterium]
MYKLILVTAFTFLVLVAGASAGTISVDVDGACVSGSGQADPYAVVYCSIQDAITDATAGDVINVAAGTYYETLNITTTGLEIIGENRATVIIDPTGLASDNAGIYVAADNVTLQSLTLQSTVSSSLPRYGIKFGEVDGCTLEDVTARDVYRSGIDALGTSNLTITNVESRDNGGHGLSLVDCNGVDVTDFTASGNGWQNVSVATWGRYTPLGTSDIVFDGTNTFGDLFQLEMGDYNNPGVPPAGAAIITYSTNILDGADVTVQASDFGFGLHGEQDDSPDQVRIWFFSTLANAAIVPGLGGGGHWTGNDMYIESLTDGTQLYVTPGCSIQAAIDAADPGDEIHVLAGTYEEQVYIDKSLDLVGAGIGSSIIEAVALGDRTTYSITQWTGPSRTIDACIGVVDAGTVNISGFTVDGKELGPNNFYGIHYFNTSGSVTDCRIEDITDAATPGNSRVVSLVATHGVSETITIDFSDNVIPNFQKGGIVLMGPGVTFTVDRNWVAGVISSSIAGNCIQLSYGATGTTANNYVEGTAYTGSDWASTGILLFESGDISMDGDSIYDCESGVNFSDWGWTYNHPVPVNLGFAGLALDNNEWSLGIQLSRDNSDVNMTVTDCDVLNSTGDGIDFYCTGVDPWGGSYYTGWNNGDLNATVTGCYITGTTLDGIWGGDYSGNANNVSIAVNDCMFSGNVGSAINNDFTQRMNASACYWNDAAGPTIGVKSGGERAVAPMPRPYGDDIPKEGVVVTTETTSAKAGETIFGDIDYTPWLGSGTLTSPGFDGDYSILYVDANSPQTGTTFRIQEGVDLATGSTVNVLDGTYGADPATGKGVYITNDGLSLIGQSQAGTIIDGSIGGVGSSASYWPRGIHIQANNTTVQNFTVKGFTGDLASTGGYGVLHRDYAHDTPAEGYIFYDGCTVDHVTVDSCYSVVYALCFTNLTVTNCVLYDNYSDGMFIARGSDGAVIHDNVVTNSGDHGIWVGKCWMGLDPSHNALIYNNDVNGAREGGISFVGSDNATIYDNTITNAASEGWSVGALSLKDGPTNVTAYDNTIYNNDGAWNGYAGLGHGVGVDGGASNINLYGNRIFGNAGLGVYNASTKASGGTWEPRLNEDDIPATSDHMGSLGGSRALVMAEDNYWGTYDGPLDNLGTDEATITTCYPVASMKNTVDEGGWGLGNGVSENVDYCPWTSEALVFTPDQILYYCSGNLSFDLGITYAVLDLEAANIMIKYPANLSLVGVTMANANYQLFQALEFDNASGYDSVRIHMGVLVGSEDGPATLFTVELTGSTDICTGDQISMTQVDLRDSNNDPIPAPLALPIDIVADCEDPVLTVNTADGGYYNVPPVVNLQASDNCDLDAIYYQIDACVATGWTAIAVDLSGTTYGPTDWPMSATDWLSLSEAQHCINFKVVDDNGRVNVDSCTNWCFTKDITPPSSPTNLLATPGHNKVNLSWTNATSDFNHTVVMRSDWYAGGHGYPEYDDNNAEGPYPSDTSSFDYIYAGTGTSQMDTDDLSNSTRDVYHYTAFTVDAAGNVSAASNGARSTSYWLGDLAGSGGLGYYDGSVYFEDLTIFSGAYGTTPSSIHYEHEADWGPTVTGNPKGIPTTDDQIEFEDLAIFAINFDAVSPMFLKDKPILEHADLPIATNTSLWIKNRIEGDFFFVDIYLDNALNLAKSLLGELTFDGTRLHYVSASMSSSLADCSVPVFFRPLASENKVAVSMAILGEGLTFTGSGLIATVKFELAGSGMAKVRLSRQEIRDNQNSDLTSGMDPVSSVAEVEIPSDYRVMQNQPNPFNPTTMISYALVKSTHVTVRVYNITGQLVRTLVDDYQPAGTHQVIWDATSETGIRVASGIYFYRVETADFSKTMKMILMK